MWSKAVDPMCQSKLTVRQGRFVADIYPELSFVPPSRAPQTLGVYQAERKRTDSSPKLSHGLRPWKGTGLDGKVTIVGCRCRPRLLYLEWSWTGQFQGRRRGTGGNTVDGRSTQFSRTGTLTLQRRGCERGKSDGGIVTTFNDHWSKITVNLRSHLVGFTVPYCDILNWHFRLYLQKRGVNWYVFDIHFFFFKPVTADRCA